MKVHFKHILLMLLVLAGIVISISSCKNRKSTAVADSAKKELWTCSMHPEIIRDKPGICPICGMDLVKKEENATAISGIHLDDLLQPTDRFVVSSIPATTIKKAEEFIEVDALGTIAYDTRFVNSISARVSGRIEKLYVRHRYQDVMKGQRIMDIYSPELLTTQQELLFLIKNDPTNSSLINATKEKLRLLGMSEGQLQQIIRTQKPSLTVTVYSNYNGHIHEAGSSMSAPPGQEQKMVNSRTTEELPIKEGMYVEKGQSVFQVYDTHMSWVLLNIFPEYQSLIRKGDVVRVIPETAPAKDFRAKVDFIEPFYRKENKTLTARVHFNNSQLLLPVGSQVRATIFTDSREANWLPKDAVLSLGMDKVVFLKTGGGYKAHKVATGLSYKNQIQIVSGLTETDSVAANAQFLTDSENFIKVKD